MFAALPSDLLPLVLPEASPCLRLVCREWRDAIDAAHDATVRPRLEALLTSCCCVARYAAPRGMVLRYAVMPEGPMPRWRCDDEEGRRYRCARCRRRVHELGDCRKCKVKRLVFPWPRIVAGPSLLALAALALSLQRPR